MYVLFLMLSLWSGAFAHVTEEEILKASRYAGAEAECTLNDLLKSDYHCFLSLYYKNKKEAGFMALERFNLALRRAIGDLRAAAHIKDSNLREREVLKAFHNWQQAFSIALVKK